MLKRKSLTLTIAIMLFSSIVSTNASALEMSVGGMTWFNWWKFSEEGSNSISAPTFLYGPVLSIKLNDDFNMTLVFLYGAYEFTDEDMGITTKSITRRTDGDLAINYRLNNYFKIFAGAKYLNFWDDGSIINIKDKDNHSSIGPSAGLSAVLPVADNFYLLGNISALYLWGDRKDENGATKYNFKNYGINSSIAIAYYIDSASTTISLGGRYQLIKYIYPHEPTLTMSWYGITLAANYSFNI